jgi:hypothetical protein
MSSPTTATSMYQAEYLFDNKALLATTLEEERREVFDGVLDSMRIQEPDADRVAACAFLLRHLAYTQSRY